MARRPLVGRVAALLVALSCALGVSVLTGAGALAVPGLDDPPAPVQATAPVSDVPVQQNTCRAYASSNGYGISCGTGGGGRTLREIFRDADLPACWLDPDLPDGFRPPYAVQGSGTWYLKTCVTLEGARAVAAYEFCHDSVAPCDGLRELTEIERGAVGLILGRGQIPFLQAQTSPVSSPRVNQPVSFSLLEDDDAPGYRTPSLTVAGVTLYAQLDGLRVLPEGAGGPQVSCTGAGRVMTAEQLEAYQASDTTACVHTYDRSSNGRRSGPSQDRYRAQVSAFWTVFVTDVDGTRVLGTYEKRSVSDVRVTEVQTLVVS